MKAEQDRIKRQQQYLGAAMGQVEAMREVRLRSYVLYICMYACIYVYIYI